jgi:hypothetical protein
MPGGEWGEIVRFFPGNGLALRWGSRFAQTTLGIDISGREQPNWANRLKDDTSRTNLLCPREFLLKWFFVEMVPWSLLLP